MARPCALSVTRDFQTTNPPEPFTPEEQALLAPYVTNTNQSIFVLKNLPEVVKGALFSRYSRSHLGLRTLLLQEFIQNQAAAFDAIQGGLSEENLPQTNQEAVAIERAQDFYDRVLDGYGDDSIGELGGAHLAIENVSILATKHLQDARIGGSPLEKSTRYVAFHKKVNGDDLFYQNPKLLQSSHKQTYLDINNLLFETYAQMVEPMNELVQSRLPRAEGASEGAYQRAVRAKVFDVIRGLLPASTLTNMGIFGNGRFFETWLTKLQTLPSVELQEIAHSAFGELNKVIPSFIRRASVEHRHFQSYQKYALNSQNLVQHFTKKYVQAPPEKTGQRVRLIDYDPEAETKFLASLLYPHSGCSLSQIRHAVAQLSQSEKEQIVQQSVALRENRRHKPGRALEMVFYTFDIQGDYGMYRDLQRHRALTQERQLLSTRLGYETPLEIEESGWGATYHRVMAQAAEAYETIALKHPWDAQYVVPLSYHIRWHIHVNLRSLVWLIELRSAPQGHENYRQVAQELFKRVEEVHPLLAQYIKFVNLDPYPLGRLDAEKRQETKRL